MLIRDAFQVPFTNSTASAIDAGTPQKIGSIFGVTETYLRPGESGVISLTGTWTLPCGDSLTADAGAIAYWDDTNKKVVASGTSLLAIGTFLNAVASGSTECTVVVFPTATYSAGS